VKWPLQLYRSAALVKVLLERLRRAIRALRVLCSTLTMLATQGAALRISRSAPLSLRLSGGAWLDGVNTSERCRPNNLVTDLQMNLLAAVKAKKYRYFT
jgi:hypothetical protein